ncbi:cytochrome c [Sinimarinibacterium sp. CAU 1509]|uniref:c-type cytochrome n=1 Tax=Sinimarinibacterium sp. CAU 1509 TaxID=2562283 RepID=UPI0010AC5E3E|nr:cytochrome c [Sinimarinibacterium sp. CAU 1509]TJY61068.1 cytochrome c [Sinimarinibacterium sp. CAU 1509]
MSRRIFPLTVLGACILALTAACGQKSAPVDPAVKAVQKARHDGFEAMGDAFKSIIDALKAGGSLDAKMTEAAHEIDKHAGQIVDWFPAGSGPESGAKTEAKAEIWQQPELFAEKREKLVVEAGKFAALADAGDAAGFAEQVKAVGGSCKGCHDTFREKDED